MNTIKRYITENIVRNVNTLIKMMMRNRVVTAFLIQLESIRINLLDLKKGQNNVGDKSYRAT